MSCHEEIDITELAARITKLIQLSYGDLITEIINAANMSVYVGQPISINQGFCYAWAALFSKELPTSQIIWGDDLDNSIPNAKYHCFVKYRDNYYDAEAIEGVSDWKLLPFFNR